MIQFEDFQKVLRVMDPFVPRSLVEGTSIGLSICDNGVLFASTSGSRALYSFDSPVSDVSFVLPRDIIPKLLKLSYAREWKGFMLDNNEIVLRIGRIVIRFPHMEVGACSIDVGDSCLIELPNEFLGALSWMAEFACSDDRKVNLYGLFISGEYIYACDNIRVTRRRCAGLEQLVGVFLPRPCVEVLCKDKLVTSAWHTDSVLGFLEHPYVFNFSKFGAEFPNLEPSVLRALESESVSVEIVDSSGDIAEFRDMLTGDLSDVPVEVSFVDSQLEVRTLSGISKFKFNVAAKVSKPFDTFLVKGLYFVNGLLHFDTLKVADKCIIFQSKAADQIVMKIVR